MTTESHSGPWVDSRRDHHHSWQRCSITPAIFINSLLDHPTVVLIIHAKLRETRISNILKVSGTDMTYMIFIMHSGDSGPNSRGGADVTWSSPAITIVLPFSYVTKCVNGVDANVPKASP